MPAKKNNNKKRKRNGKYSRASLTKVSPKAVICYCPKTCPDVMRVQLRYISRIGPSGGAIVDIQDFVYRGNGPFDPEFAAGGSQPMGYDQWSAFYRKYRVRAAKITVKTVNNSDSAVWAFIAALNTSSAITNRSQLAEFEYSTTKPIARKGSGDAKNEISMYVTTAEIRGRPHDIVDYESGLASLNNTVPSLGWFFHVGAYAQGGNSTTFDTSQEVMVTYYMDFFDRETLLRS